MIRATARGARVAALALTLFTAVGALTGCQSSFAGLRLTIATGNEDGVYFQLGTKLAGVWSSALGIATPTVRETDGSPENVTDLHAGVADIAFASADAIDDAEAGPHRLRALARIYDDYTQIVVRANGPIRSLSDLADRRVAMGPANSQVALVASRILAAAGVQSEIQSPLNLDDSIKALADDRIDAFFWSGGLPTKSLQTLDGTLKATGGIRLLDLGTDPSHAMRTVLDKYPVYGTAVIPVGTYRPGSPPVTTLVVPNFLLVTDAMPDDVSNALVSSLFAAAPQLAGVNSAAEAIDIHTAIYTDPVPLHPGAEAYYRSSKI